MRRVKIASAATVLLIATSLASGTIAQSLAPKNTPPDIGFCLWSVNDSDYMISLLNDNDFPVTINAPVLGKTLFALHVDQIQDPSQTVDLAGPANDSCNRETIPARHCKSYFISGALPAFENTMYLYLPDAARLGEEKSVVHGAAAILGFIKALPRPPKFVTLDPKYLSKTATPKAASTRRAPLRPRAGSPARPHTVGRTRAKERPTP